MTGIFFAWESEILFAPLHGSFVPVVLVDVVEIAADGMAGECIYLSLIGFILRVVKIKRLRNSVSVVEDKILKFLSIYNFPASYLGFYV